MRGADCGDILTMHMPLFLLS